MQKCYNVSIVGKVQDIGFRAVIEYAGRLLDLSGIVFNAKDGTVRIICRGENGAIRDFSREIKTRGEQRGAIIQDIDRQEIPFNIELPYPFSRVLADEDIDIGRKLDKGNELLTDIKGDTSTLKDIKGDTSALVIEMREHNKEQRDFNKRLEKILEKLAGR